MKEKLSVIIPVYNVEKYLCRCLDSVLAQTYPVYEVICVDDGSTDGSLAILKEYSMKDKRVKVIHQSNHGLVSARKAGVNRAKGEYVAYVDSDDWIENNMYEEMMRTVNSDTTIDLVTSGCIKDYGEIHSVIENEDIKEGIYTGNVLVEKILFNLISTDNFFQSKLSCRPINKIYRRELLIKYQNKVDDRINMMEGSACVYPYIFNSKKIVVMGKSYYHYCIREDSITGIVQNDEKERYNILFSYLKNELKVLRNIIPSINLQIFFLEIYARLVQHPEDIVQFKDGMFFPFGKIDKNDRIIIYGAGNFGRRLAKVLNHIDKVKVVAIADKVEKETSISIDKIKEIEFDKILIAVGLSSISKQIKEELISRDIDSTKIYSIEAELIKEFYKKNCV